MQFNNKTSIHFAILLSNNMTYLYNNNNFEYITEHQQVLHALDIILGVKQSLM